MEYRDSTQYALENLPARMPRGSTENMIRGFMFPLLLKGLTREEAERIAKEKAISHGFNVEALSLQYRKE